MPMSSKIEKRGRITTGEQAGFLVRVEDDTLNTGGYLILSWREGADEGFDNWVESKSDLDRFFEESGWNVEWLE